MDRRNFIKNAALTGALAGFSRWTPDAFPVSPETHDFRTRHLIWIINGGGSRKRDWYERPDFSPNFARLAREGFSYEEDHNDTVANHNQSWTELITGNPGCGAIPHYPTLPHYVRKAYGDKASNYFYLNGVNRYRHIRLGGSHVTAHPAYGEETRPVLLTMSRIYALREAWTPKQIAEQEFGGMGLALREKKRMEEFVEATLCARPWELKLRHNPAPREPMLSEAAALAILPALLQSFKPRIVVVQMAGHDVAHESYAEYERVCKTTDELLGRLLDFIQADPYFSKYTAIVVRPEVGRDDQINAHGELNHSMGYDQCHRSASIFWGPDFRPGKTSRLVNRTDMVPTLARLFNVAAPYARGRVRAHPVFGGNR